MATTTNFGWETPDDTDLVKDGALAMRTLGNAIDTSLVDLKGGTTGQVLSKTSNTDMDFTWVTSDDANAIQNAIVDAKGDLITATAADTPARLAVGSNGDTLVADSAATTGLRWQGNYAAGKNRITNGFMVIDQRGSASSAISSTATFQYAVDRWGGIGQTADGVFSLGQDSSAPAGFTKSLKATVTTADASIGSTQTYLVEQRIEGSNVADLDFGLSTAKTITVSFWVRSSLTGTFGGAIRNSASDRSYPFSYSISVADTWEKKTVTIAGDTTGTWLKDTGVGLRLTFSLGGGTDRVGTAGAWVGANNSGVTGQVQVIGTLNATWYLTGVQLEIGSVATAFQTATGTLQGELAAAMRYYQVFGGGLQGSWDNTTTAVLIGQCVVPMRTAPTLALSSTTLTFGVQGGTDLTSSGSAIAFSSIGSKGFRVGINGFTGATQYRSNWVTTQSTDVLTASAEL